jgi:hypothetical protein
MTPPDEGGEAPCFEHLLEQSPGSLDDAALAQLRRLQDRLATPGKEKATETISSKH